MHSSVHSIRSTVGCEERYCDLVLGTLNMSRLTHDLHCKCKHHRWDTVKGQKCTTPAAGRPLAALRTFF